MAYRLILRAAASFLLLVLFSGCGAISQSMPTATPTPDFGAMWATFQADPCSPGLIGIQVDSEAAANVKTWNDLNANGKIDIGEPDFPWVSYYLDNSYMLLLTDAHGAGRDSRFLAGCTCECWKGHTVSVQVPTGYRATTPTTQPLTGDNLEYEFGVVQTAHSLADFSGEPDWYRAFTNMGFEVTAFHFDPDRSHFDMTLAVSSVDDWEDFYQRLFSTILAVPAQDSIAFDDFTITLTPAGTVISCSLQTIRANAYSNTKAESVAQTYCIE